MKQFLDQNQRRQLVARHKAERDAIVCDRIKAVLWLDKGRKIPEIAELLMVDESTVRRHIKDFLNDDQIGGGGLGTPGLLNEDQTQKLKEHLAESDVPTAAHAVAQAVALFGIRFSVSGMTDWLHAHGFSYKKQEPVPAKADRQAQQAWIEEYRALKKALPENEAILFLDACHPTQATKIGYSWSLVGKRKTVQSRPGRSRVNVLGTLDPVTMKMTTSFPETVNSHTLVEHLKQLRKSYAGHATLHVVLDQGSYNRSLQTQEAAKKLNIRLLFLPPYSPNLNLIERAWKMMNELERNNKSYPDANTFASDIKAFFRNRWRSLKKSQAARFADHFQVFKPAN